MSEFVIQTNSDVPLYRQLINQVRRMAASGRMDAGERMPSVRHLAEELAVNPMTVSKAYSLLEQEGLLERRRGVGMVLRGGADTRDELIIPTICELVNQAGQLGFDRTTIIKLFTQEWEKQHDRSSRIDSE